MDDILSGIIQYARKEIQERIELEAKKIIGEVITKIMGGLKFSVFKRPEDMLTEIRFIFNIKDDE